MPVNGLLLLAASLAWASEYLFIRWADDALPPLTVTVAMLAVAAVALFAYAGLVRGRPLLPMLRARARDCLILSVTLVAGPEFTLIWAEDSITADDAALSGATVPMLTLLVSMFVTHQQRIAWLPLAGIAVALGGLVLFVGPGDEAGTSTVMGLLIREAGLAIFVFGGIYASLQARDLDKAVLTAWTMALSALLLLPPALLLERPDLAAVDGAVLGSILASGVVSLAVAYLVYFALIDRAGATFAALYAYLVPPLSLLLGVILEGEALTTAHLGGLALVLAGLWMVARRDDRIAASPAGKASAA